MNVNTLVGAILAALILLRIKRRNVIHQPTRTLTFADFSTAMWVSLVGGAAVAFLKDYQAI